MYAVGHICDGSTARDGRGLDVTPDRALVLPECAFVENRNQSAPATHRPIAVGRLTISRPVAACRARRERTLRMAGDHADGDMLRRLISAMAASTQLHAYWTSARSTSRAKPCMMRMRRVMPAQSWSGGKSAEQGLQSEAPHASLATAFQYDLSLLY